jgi:hypothetical protein
VLESFLEVGDEVIGSLRLDHHIIDVGLDVAAYLLSKAALYGPLVSCTSIFESEGHGSVIVHVKGHNEGRLNLVFLL